MQKPELSIIIISYNTAKITIDGIKSIIRSIKNRLPYEIIVVDNASTDDSLTEISKHKEQNQNLNFKTIANKKNFGFGKANNQAVKEAQGKYILLLNSDIIVLDNAIERLLNFYKQQENQIHFLGGKLFNKDMTPQPSCGPFYTLPVIFAALFLKGDYWGLTRYSPNNLKKVDWVSGACILTKKEYYEKIGGFDEGIFMYMEEIDLLYRAKLKRYQTYFYPQAPFIHLGFASSGSKSAPIINVYRGFLYLYKKHFPGLPLFFLKILLKLKAQVAIFIGKITQNSYLIDTYEKALKLVKMV
jgi:GT2 family glycosyltransferase